ncbi:chromate transporter [Alteribacillus sp. HJP-4]|uniref:chromate transporter n=1 Tax=Alteribacillus sp. HJP-4 TaxID=2775394 RepID=UPI0035CD1E1E
MDWSTQKKLFTGFFRAGMLGYGGGPASIPLVHKEVVENYDWITDEEFQEILAIGNTLPGPIFTKMAGYIGYRIAGPAGLLTALAASVLPTVVLMISLIGFLMAFRESPIIAGMTQAIAAVVGVMLMSLTYQTVKSAKAKVGWPMAVFLCIFSIIILELLNIHPAILIVVLLTAGFTLWNLPKGVVK